MITITAVNGRPVGGIKRPTVKKGQTVRIVVRTNVGTQVHLHGYNIEKNVKKGVPTVIQFVAKVQGRFDARAASDGRVARPADGEVVITQLLPHVLAHGIGGVQDLPVPKWLFFWGGAFVLVVSFIALGALWKTPQLEQHVGRPRPRRDVQQARARAGADRRPGALGVPLRRRPRRRALRHDATRSATSPRPGSTSSSGSACRCCRCCSATSGGRSARGGRSPTGSSGCGSTSSAARRGRWPPTRERLGRYPGCVAFFAFVALELCYSNPVEPAGARVRDRALLVRGAVRDARVRARHLDARGRGVRDPVRVHRPDRAVRRPRGPDPAAGAAHRARGRRAHAGLGAVPGGRARLGRVRRLQPHDHLAGPRRAGRGAVRPQRARQGRAPRHGAQPARAPRRDRARARARFSAPARSPARR